MDVSKLMNPQAFMSIFGEIPTFVNSELLDVQLKREGPTLFIRLMTNQLVKKKPARWMDKWDVIYIEMSFFATRNLAISGWSSTNLIDQFEIKETDDEGFLNIRCSNQTQIQCAFDWARVEQVSPGLIGTP